MKQKHYPITVCGHKAVYTVELTGFNMAKISFKFNHRRGQTVVITHLEDEDLVDIHDCPDYTIIAFHVNTSDVKHTGSYGQEIMVNRCKGLIDTVDYAVNFEAKEELVTKELLIVLG